MMNMKALDTEQEDIVDQWIHRANGRLYFDETEEFWVQLYARIPQDKGLHWGRDDEGRYVHVTDAFVCSSETSSTVPVPMWGHDFSLRAFRDRSFRNSGEDQRPTHRSF